MSDIVSWGVGGREMGVGGRYLNTEPIAMNFRMGFLFHSLSVLGTVGVAGRPLVGVGGREIGVGGCYHNTELISMKYCMGLLFHSLSVLNV